MPFERPFLLSVVTQAYSSVGLKLAHYFYIVLMTTVFL